MFRNINGEINQLYVLNWLIINVKYHIYCTKILDKIFNIKIIKNVI